VKIKIEICCGSVDDVILSELVGAHRVELNSALELGGLTPSIGSLRLAREKTSIEIIAMLRPRGFGFCYSDSEFETMLTDLPLLLENDADGIAFGILTENGELDDERCKIILDKMDKYGADKEVVFHMAFDEAKTDELEMLSRIEAIGFTRLLTKGRASTAVEGIEALERYIEYTEKKGLRLEILPGGGIRQHNALDIITKTGATQLHGQYHKDAGDGARVVDLEGLRSYVESLKCVTTNVI